MKSPFTSPVRRDIIVIGGSSGAVTALKSFLPQVSPDLEAAIFIVIHTAHDSPGALAGMIDEMSSVPARYAEPDAHIRKGRIYVAPANQHLMLSSETMLVERGPRENRFRPSIDVLFRTAAVNHGKRVIAVLLSGYLDDGVAGLQAIHECGGITIVQAPHDALVSDLPTNALRHVQVDHNVPVADIPLLLKQLTERLVEGDPLGNVPERLKREAAATSTKSEPETLDKFSERTTFTCPECSGLLWEIKEASGSRFRCHEGHAYSAEVFAQEQADLVERALGLAVRSMADSARLAFQMERDTPDKAKKAMYHYTANKALKDAETLRRMLFHPDVKDELLHRQAAHGEAPSL